MFDCCVLIYLLSCYHFALMLQFVLSLCALVTVWSLALCPSPSKPCRWAEQSVSSLNLSSLCVVLTFDNSFWRHLSTNMGVVFMCVFCASSLCFSYFLAFSIVFFLTCALLCIHVLLSSLCTAIINPVGIKGIFL